MEGDESYATCGVFSHNSKQPNLQNVPNPENDVWNIRGVYIAPEGYVLIVIDYKQLEMRLLACASNDVAMQGVFLKEWDIHMGNASLMFDVPYDDIVAAKKMDKLIKAGEAAHGAELNDYMKECLAYRYQVKAIGFGQLNSQAEVKPTQNGETYGPMAYGNPVLPSAKGSVSTWGRRPLQQEDVALAA